MSAVRFVLQPNNRNPSEEDMLEDLRRVAALFSAESVTQAQYDGKVDPKIKGRFASRTIARKFRDRGGWNGALIKAGLTENRTPMNIPDPELFKNLEELWIRHQREPVLRDLGDPNSRYSKTPYQNRPGGWRTCKEDFVAYINNEETAPSEDAIRNWKIEAATKHRTPRDINSTLRVKVWKRDNHKCQICGRSPATDPTIVLHVDHINAWVNGGETVLENLQTLCSKCNRGKSDLDFIEPAKVSAEGATT